MDGPRSKKPFIAAARPQLYKYRYITRWLSHRARTMCASGESFGYCNYIALACTFLSWEFLYSIYLVQARARVPFSLGLLLILIARTFILLLGYIGLCLSAARWPSGMSISAIWRDADFGGLNYDFSLSVIRFDCVSHIIELFRASDELESIINIWTYATNVRPMQMTSHLCPRVRKKARERLKDVQSSLI